MDFSIPTAIWRRRGAEKNKKKSPQTPQNPLRGGSIRASPRAFHPRRRRVGAAPPQTHSSIRVPVDLHRAQPIFPQADGWAVHPDTHGGGKGAGGLLRCLASYLQAKNKCWEKPKSSIKLYRISFYTWETTEQFPEPAKQKFFFFCFCFFFFFPAAAPAAFRGTISTACSSGGTPISEGFYFNSLLLYLMVVIRGCWVLVIWRAASCKDI